jgi:pimeloyl-ACP methyl ester carboxylesterase
MTSVLLLHHFGGSARTWDEVHARLLDVETEALDLPGFGDAAGMPGPYTVAAYADFVEARLPRGPLVLVGHSMGGKVALALAARQPAGLSGLLLVAPSPPTPEPIADDVRAKLITGWGDQDEMSRTLATITAHSLADPLRALAVADMVRAGRAAWTAWLTSGSRTDISGEIGTINVPVTILSGSADAVLPTALLHREVAERLSGSALLPIPGAGHLLPLEAPDAVAAAIRRLIAEAPGRDKRAASIVPHAYHASNGMARPTL